jgi:hypothetical protein
MIKEENTKDSEIVKILKDVLKDHSISDSTIIENLQLIPDLKRMQSALVETENYSLLHIAAENERHLLCAYLIDVIQIGKYKNFKKKDNLFYFIWIFTSIIN